MWAVSTSCSLDKRLKGNTSFLPSCLGVSLASSTPLVLLLLLRSSFSAQKPASQGFKTGLHTSSRPGVLQSLNSRVGLCKHPASWTQPRPSPPPLQSKRAIVGLPRQYSGSWSKTPPFLCVHSIGSPPLESLDVLLQV